MSEHEGLRQGPLIDFEGFNAMPLEAKQLMIYMGRSDREHTLDFGREELSMAADPKKEGEQQQQALDVALGQLVAQGIIKRGINPREGTGEFKIKRNLTPEQAASRYYIPPEVFSFVNEELPRKWKELGMME